jgi:hypothetical protein
VLETGASSPPLAGFERLDSPPWREMTILHYLIENDSTIYIDGLPRNIFSLIGGKKYCSIPDRIR